MSDLAASATPGWRARLPEGVRPYLESAPLAASFLGISSGFAFAMIGATLTTRLAQHGIRKSAVTAFALTFLAYNFKFLWAPLVDTVRLPVLGRFGQRRSWLWLVGRAGDGAVAYLGSVDPTAALPRVAIAAILVGIAGATFDIVIDAYRIELLEPRQLGVGSGMSQYGWRIGAAAAGALALVLAARFGWAAAYAACALFALPAMLVGVVMGEPARRRPPPRHPHGRRGGGRLLQPAGRVPAAPGRAGRAGVRAHPQDRRHARQPDAAAAVRGSAVHQRRDRLLRRRRRLRRAADRRVRRRRDVRVARHEALGVRQPGADGGVEPQLRRARGRRPQQPRAWPAPSASRTSPAASAA